MNQGVERSLGVTMMTSENEVKGRVRVVFQLDQNDGWPPVTSERLWGIPLTDELVRIDNVPWFVRDLSLNDVVRTFTGARGVLQAAEKITWSGNCTVRIIPYKSGAMSGNLQTILELFLPLGAHAEGIEQFGMVALNVPPSADLAAVKGLLIRGFEADWWDYEESCIGDAWLASNPR